MELALQIFRALRKAAVR